MTLGSVLHEIRVLKGYAETAPESAYRKGFLNALEDCEEIVLDALYEDGLDDEEAR